MSRNFSATTTKQYFEKLKETFFPQTFSATTLLTTGQQSPGRMAEETPR